MSSRSVIDIHKDFVSWYYARLYLRVQKQLHDWKKELFEILQSLPQWKTSLEYYREKKLLWYSEKKTESRILGKEIDAFLKETLQKLTTYSKIIVI